jgi:hypothetical protein
MASAPETPKQRLKDVSFNKISISKKSRGLEEKRQKLVFF